MGKKCEDLEKDKYSYVCICTISVDVIIQNHKSQCWKETIPSEHFVS